MNQIYLHISGFFIYRELMRCLLLCNSRFIYYSKFKSWDEGLIWYLNDSCLHLMDSHKVIFLVVRMNWVPRENVNSLNIVNFVPKQSIDLNFYIESRKFLYFFTIYSMNEYPRTVSTSQHRGRFNYVIGL